MKRLDLIVGPNGAGKTTLINTHLAALMPATPFVNADEIAKRLWPEQDPMPLSYEAAKIAAKTRRALIRQGRSFIAETVFSHPSKLELIHQAQNAGYTVHLRALLIPEDLTVARVAARIQNGGHHVPEHKIRARYHRVWPLIAQAILLADSSVVYDNSEPTSMRITARLYGGHIMGMATWPDWTPDPLHHMWPNST